MPKVSSARSRPSQICVDGQYLRNIKGLAEAWFPTQYRIVSLKSDDGSTPRAGGKNHFKILLVDAAEDKIKAFLNKYPMCKIENTLSRKK